MTESAGKIGPNSVEFDLVYEGPDVDDGSISTRDLINALTGTHDAFARIASEYDGQPSYSLRVADIQAGSVDIVFRAVAFAKADPGAATAIAVGTSAVVQVVSNAFSGLYRVVTDLAKLLDVKRFLKGKQISTTEAKFDDRTVVLVLSDRTRMALTKEQYEMLLSRRIDAPLSKLVSPLGLGKVQALEVRHQGEPLARVDVAERDYFDYTETTEDKSREGTEIEGTLNSLSKSNLRGTFYTSQGVHVPYRYVGGNLTELIQGFAARETVRCYGRVRFGSDGVPTAIEVESIEPVQNSLLN